MLASGRKKRLFGSIRFPPSATQALHHHLSLSSKEFTMNTFAFPTIRPVVPACTSLYDTPWETTFATWFSIGRHTELVAATTVCRTPDQIFTFFCQFNWPNQIHVTSALSYAGTVPSLSEEKSIHPVIRTYTLFSE